MSKRTDEMKRKAKKNLAKARVKLSNSARAFRLAAKRYRVALKNS